MMRKRRKKVLSDVTLIIVAVLIFYALYAFFIGGN